MKNRKYKKEIKELKCEINELKEEIKNLKDINYTISCNSEYLMELRKKYLKKIRQLKYERNIENGREEERK